jgi:hypothetical protein
MSPGVTGVAGSLTPNDLTSAKDMAIVRGIHEGPPLWAGSIRSEGENPFVESGTTRRLEP